MYMTCKHYLGHVLGVERSKLECLGKRVLKFEIFLLNWWVFAWASAKRALKRACPVDSGHRLLERAPSELQVNKPSWFWTQVAWASSKGAASEQVQDLLKAGRLSEQPFA